MASAPLLERDFLEKLERLTIQWQRSFPGLVGGHNMSRFAGAGQEFLDHRNFHHGDDLRAVNWRAYMRLEKLFLKMFQIEPRVPVRFLIDTSVSMSAVNPDKVRLRAQAGRRAGVCGAGAAGYARDPQFRVAPGPENLLHGRAAPLQIGGRLPDFHEGRRGAPISSPWCASSFLPTRSAAW